MHVENEPYSLFSVEHLSALLKNRREWATRLDEQGSSILRGSRGRVRATLNVLHHMT